MLERLDEGIWIAAAPQTFMGIHVGTRMTVVRLASGELWVHSPIALGAELGAAVDALGPVRHIVASNVYHHLYAGAWKEAYPQASLWGPAALAKKRRDLALSATLEHAAEAPWASELEPLHIDGCMLDETVFLHRATRTLISSDLTENFESSPHWPTRVYLKLGGIYGRPGWNRLLRFVYRDRAATRRSVDTLLAKDFDRLVLAHGAIVDSGGKDVVRATFSFL